MTEARLKQLKENLSKLGFQEASGGAEGYRVEVIHGQVKVTILLDYASQDGKAESFRTAIRTAGLQQRLQNFEVERTQRLAPEDPAIALFREANSLLTWAAIDRRSGPSYKAFSSVRRAGVEVTSSRTLMENFKEITESREEIRNIAQLRHDRARSEDTRKTVVGYLAKEEKLFEMLRIIIKHSTPITYLIEEHYSHTQLRFVAKTEAARETVRHELRYLNIARDRVFTRPSAASNQYYLDTAKAFYANAELRALFISELKNARISNPTWARQFKDSWSSFKAAGDDMLGDIELAMLIDEI